MLQKPSVMADRIIRWLSAGSGAKQHWQWEETSRVLASEFQSFQTISSQYQELVYTMKFLCIFSGDVESLYSYVDSSSFIYCMQTKGGEKRNRISQSW